MLYESKLESLSYDDVLLLPQHSEVPSRDSVNLFNKDGYIPIFSAPMKNISGADLVIQLGKLGSVGILHRFFKHSYKRYDAIDNISQYNINYGISVSLQDWINELKFIEYSVNKGCKFVVLDSANAYLQIVLDAVKRLYDFRKNIHADFKIISGNVVDHLGCYDIAKAGADMIRVNIGTGLQCLTSKSIGIGCPSLTAIRDCAFIHKNYPEVKLLADGGIYTPGDALKALTFGSDGIMIGSLFGRAKEAKNKGVIFGMSSYTLQERMNKSKKSNEGKVTKFSKKEIRPLEEIFSEFAYGLKSGLSQLGCNDINKLHDTDIEYIRVNK